MSFVYAKKWKDTVVILSDTKITFDEKKSIKLGNENEQNAVKNYGALKSYIINKHCAIAFAGESKYMNDLLPRLFAEPDIAKIEALCLDKHKESLNAKTREYQIDFVLANYQSDTLYLCEIKNGELTQVDLTHIGSHTAFEEFQKRSEKNEPLSRMEVSFLNNDVFTSTESNTEYDTLFNRFYNAVFSCGDNGVGNFIVPLVFNNITKNFEFRSYNKNEPAIKYRPVAITGNTLHLQSSNLIGQSRENGDYSICFFGSCGNNVVVYITPISLALNFTQGRANYDKSISQFKNLCIPQIKYISIHQLQFEMQSFGFKRPSMLPMCSKEFLAHEILRFYESAKSIIDNNFAEAEKIIIYTTNVMFREYSPYIKLSKTWRYLVNS